MLESKGKKNNADKVVTNTPNILKTSFKSKNMDSIREIYETEGRTARNLVNWRVPIEATFVEKKTNPTSLQTSPVRKPRSLSSPRSVVKQSSEYNSNSLRRDIRARYWAYLFENLDRAVNEIYETCESDESVIECKEVIMMLDRHTKDFKSLIERLLVLGAYEGTDKALRPTSLTWEVRTSSPGKLFRDSSLIEKQLSNSVASKHLSFAVSPSQSINKTWADRVKKVENNFSIKKQTQTNKENNPNTKIKIKNPTGNNKVNFNSTVTSNRPIIKSLTADETGEGWEVVQRNGKPRSRGSTPTIQNSNNKIISKSILVDTKNSDPIINCEKRSHEIIDFQVVNETISSETLTDKINNDYTTSQLENNFEDAVMDDATEIINNDMVHGEFCMEGKLDKFNTDDEVLLSFNELPVDDEKQEDAEEEIDKALMSAINEEDSLEHELERKQEAALESVMEEEADFLRELARQESLEIINEPDQEQDPEDSFLNSSVNLNESFNKPLDWDAFVRQFEENKIISTTASWGDIMEETECRTPGRVVQVHEKLSSPSRKRTAVESLKQHEEKQAKACELREKHLQERAEKIRVLSKKIEEIQTWKNQLLLQMKTTMDKKLQRAEKKRQILLQMRVRKAHEEDTKLGEIAFINSLEAQNKRHEIMSKHQESEARLQDMQEERQRRYVENLAKGAAAEERRKLMAAERLLKLQEKADRRKEWESKFEMRQQEKEKERVEAAKAKDKEREERMAALREQQQSQIEELQRKIQQKQEETDRRHREKLEAIQEKASKMSIQHHPTIEEGNHDNPPNVTPYEKFKFCNICNVIISSEVFLLSHLHGKQHQSALSELNIINTLDANQQNNNMKFISDAPFEEINKNLLIEKEKIKNLRKKCKKIKLRMSKRGSEYEASLKQPNLDNENKIKLTKLIKDIEKCMHAQSSGPWSNASVMILERSIVEINKIMQKKRIIDVELFRVLGGVNYLCQILENYGQQNKDQTNIIPNKCLNNVIMCLTNLSLLNTYMCDYLLQSNKICIVIDMAFHYLNIAMPENFDPLIKNSLSLLAVILYSFDNSKYVAYDKKDNNNAMAQINDVISYIICIGIPDLLSQFFNAIRDSIDEKQLIADILASCLSSLVGLVKIATLNNCINFEKKNLIHSTQLSSTLRDTQLISIVSMLYGILLHSNAPNRGDQAPPSLPITTIAVINTAIRLLSSIACYDLQLFQECLGDEGTSLEFRHICSHLLWYCQHYPNEQLLHELILCIGYFTLKNSENQLIIQSGQPPTILQQLCSLPFAYFSDQRRMAVLFPTLICCCFKLQRNKDILKLELSSAMLANFIEARILEHAQSDDKNDTKCNTTTADQNRFKLKHRFPPILWSESQKYFEE